MPNLFLDRLVESRNRDHAAMKVIIDRCEAANREPDAAERAEFDRLSASMTASAERAARIKATEAADAQTNATLTALLGQSGGNAGDGRSSSWPPNRREYGELVQEQRVTGYSNAGAILPNILYGQWFDKLRPRSAVLSALPLLVPVEGHALDLPTLTGSATVGNYLENTTITATDPTLAKVTLTPIKFAALVIASHEASNDSSGVLGQILVDDLLKSTATAADIEFLTGPGTAGRIRGLKNVTGATVVGTPGNGAVPTLDTVLDLISSLESLGSDIANLAIFMTPGVWSVLRKIKATTGGTYLVQPDPTSPARPSLFGVRIFPTANLPQTETQGTATGICSTIIAADLSRIAVGVGQDVTVQQSDDFAFDKDAVAVRVTARFDLAALAGNAVSVTLGNKLA